MLCQSVELIVFRANSMTILQKADLHSLVVLYNATIGMQVLWRWFSTDKVNFFVGAFIKHF